MSAQIKTLKGVVTSDLMHKTVVVKSVRKVRHPIYKKYVNKTSTYHVHDENNEAKQGDVVLITPTRPLSKTKCWKLISVVTRKSASTAEE